MKNCIMQRFGEKLRTLRTKKKMTLKELALALGLTAHGYISEIESGKKKPSVDFVLHTARFFNVTTDELLKDELELIDGLEKLEDEKNEDTFGRS